jgi:hypothetical protein
MIAAEARLAHATISAPAGAQTGKSKTTQAANVLTWTAIVGIAVGFVVKYVLFYYRHYDVASFDVYWARRGAAGSFFTLMAEPWLC